MIVVYALRTEPEVQFVRTLFLATEAQREAAITGLCVEFADDPPVEIDSVSFPDDPMPTPEQASAPEYINAIHSRVVEAVSEPSDWP